MMKNQLSTLVFIAITTFSFAQMGGGCDASSTTATSDPIVTNWLFNLDNETNINGDTVNVSEVWYNDCYVYVSTDGVASYAEVGTQVFDPANLDRTYRIVRVPEVQTDPDIIVGEGQMGVFLDGSAIMSPGDGKDYNGWYSLAYEFEGFDFDNTGGHSTAGNIYHHHVNNTFYERVGNGHSPLIGFMFDGYPVYGPYGFSDSLNSGSAVVRMESSYEIIPQLVSDGTRKNMDPDAPDVTTTALKNGTAGPLGAYVEDYQFTSGLGHLDEHNGRWCVTPEYPSGTYAYFTTITESEEPAYPYHMGASSYGVIQTSIPQYSATIPMSASEYTPTITGNATILEIDNLEIFPTLNPKVLTVSAVGVSGTIQVMSSQGVQLEQLNFNDNAIIDVSTYENGAYLVYVMSNDSNQMAIETFVKM